MPVNCKDCKHLISKPHKPMDIDYIGYCGNEVTVMRLSFTTLYMGVWEGERDCDLFEKKSEGDSCTR